jgi:hypothetical protein
VFGLMSDQLVEADGGGEASSTSFADLAVDLDLGELVVVPASARPSVQQPHDVSAGGRWRPPPWFGTPRRTAAAVVVLALLAGLLGWQVGAHRTASRLSAVPTHPAVLAWLVDNGPNLSSTARDPSKDLELHVVNLGPDPVRILSVHPRARQNPVAVTLTSLPHHELVTGQAAVIAMVAHAACRDVHQSASLTVDLSVTGADGRTRAGEVPVVNDPGLGTPFVVALNGLCSHPTPDSGGVDEVYVQSTFTAEQATFILVNRAPDERWVSFVGPSSSSFRLVSAPAGLIGIAPGDSVSVTVKARVLACRNLFSLKGWTDGVHLEVRHRKALDESAGDALTPTTMPLGPFVLASLGAAVQRTCGKTV